MAWTFAVGLPGRVLMAAEAGEPVPAVARQFTMGRPTELDWVHALRQFGRRSRGSIGSGRTPPNCGATTQWGALRLPVHHG